VLVLGSHPISYTTNGSAKLVFLQGADGYYLTEVWDGDIARAVQAPRGRGAILAASKSATRVVIPAVK